MALTCGNSVSLSLLFDGQSTRNQSWISAPEVNAGIVLVETLLCVLRSCGRPEGLNEMRLDISAALRFRGEQLPCARDEIPARMGVWIQADIDKDASRNLRVQFRFDCPQAELCLDHAPRMGVGWGNNPADLQPLV